MHLKGPTGPFTIAEPQDQEISEIYVVHKRRTSDFEAPKSWKGSVGEREALKALFRENELETKSSIIDLELRQQLPDKILLAIRCTEQPHLIEIKASL